MKILIITQKVDINDGVLGFFHTWLEKMSREMDLVVLANCVGEYHLPQNVQIFSLGKEKGRNRLWKLVYYEFYLLKMLRRVDGIFFHMCPEYVLSAGFLPRLFRKKTLLWYTHKRVDWKLKLAEKMVDKIFSASPKSFRLASKKLEVTGHGIDIEKYKSARHYPRRQDGEIKIITVGRVSSVKNIDILVMAGSLLNSKGTKFEIRIIGSPILEEDKKYLVELEELVDKNNLKSNVFFIGSIPNKDIEKHYREADVFVNLSNTGSLDKAVLEAMASGLMILTSNEAFKDILPGRYLVSKNPEEIAGKIISLSGSPADDGLSDYVEKNHNLNILVKKISNFFRG